MGTISEKDAVILRSMIANGFEFKKNSAVINGKEYEIEELDRLAVLGDEIIKKAIPQKPIVMEKPLIGGTIWFKCPNCGNNSHSKFRLGHCTLCGQKLDWSEYLKTRRCEDGKID